MAAVLQPMAAGMGARQAWAATWASSVKPMTQGLLILCCTEPGLG